MEIGALLDTNRLSDFLAGDASLTLQLEHCGRVWLPFAAVAEFRYGILKGLLRNHNEGRLAALLSKPGVGILYADRQTIEHYARLQLQLRQAGTPIPINDVWIGALALQHDLRLITRDQHFQKIPQLLLV